MTQGKFIQFQENFEVRDIETKKIVKKFRSPNAAQIYLTSLPFGLKHDYEIFNDKEQKVIFTCLGGRE